MTRCALPNATSLLLVLLVLVLVLVLILILLLLFFFLFFFFFFFFFFFSLIQDFRLFFVCLFFMVIIYVLLEQIFEQILPYRQTDLLAPIRSTFLCLLRKIIFFKLKQTLGAIQDFRLFFDGLLVFHSYQVCSAVANIWTGFVVSSNGPFWHSAYRLSYVCYGG